MAAAQYLALLIALLIVMITTFGSLSSASDPGPLQDFCVADKMSNVFVNGFVCKDPKLVVPEDFFFSGLDKAGDTNNSLGSKVTNVNVENFPGLNTLGVSLARIDYEPNGLNPPHFHPRATEVITVLEGSLYLGFVTSNPNRFFTKTLSKGDVFVFPKSLIHFQMNTDRDRKAVAMSAFSSQNPGVVTVANAIFGSNPQISDDVLSKAFQVDKKTVDWLQAQFWTDNN